MLCYAMAGGGQPGVRCGYSTPKICEFEPF